MTATNRVAAACGVMLMAAIAGSYKSEPIAATIIDDDPQPTPELAEVSPPPPAGAQEREVSGQDAPAVEWLDWDDAAELSRLTTRPVLVFQHCAKGKPISFEAATLLELNKLGILCRDTAERWQHGVKEPIAPSVAYVKHDAKLGSQPPFLDAPRVDDPSALLKQLKAWINAIEAP